MESNLINLLAEGDMRTVKNVNKVMQILETNPDLIKTVLTQMQGSSEGVAMRSADCLEKISRKNADILQPFSSNLMDILQNVPQKEVRWHLAQILPRLTLSQDSLRVASRIWIQDFYNSSSSIVRTESLQALYEIRDVYPQVMADLTKAISHSLRDGTSAVKARARLLTRDM